MTKLRGPVGIRNGSRQVDNAVADQSAVIDLLSRIGPDKGGQQGVWQKPAPGSARHCPAILAQAIRTFQKGMVDRGELAKADGVVDPGGKTLGKLDALAGAGPVVPPVVPPVGPPVVVDPLAITFRQTNDAKRTQAHDVSQMVISPLATASGFLQEISQTGSIQEFLFEMRKDGAVYWVGAAVPKGTTDFTKAQVFFHPTVQQQNGDRIDVHAAEADYPAFRGGWSDSLQRYVALQGAQLAGARQTTLIVPFMTMAAFGGKAPAYMFATRPVPTLNAIVNAIRDAVTSVKPGPAEPVQLARIGVSSFSSGIGAMELFIRTFGNSGLIAEVTDFDGPYISARPKTLTKAPGAVSRVFSQVPPARAQPGWLTMWPKSLSQINTFRADGPHGQIGWMTYFVASISSVIR